MHTLAREGDLAVMTLHESWRDYVRRETAGLSRKEIAAAAGIHVSGVSRWLNESTRPSPEKVISFARGLDLSPIGALVAAGYLDGTDIEGAVEVMQSLTALSDDALIDELASRLRRRDRDQPETGLTRVERHLSRKGMGVQQPDNSRKKRS